MLKRIILSTIGLAVLIAATTVSPVAPSFTDPPPDCFPFDCPTPNDPPDTLQ